MVYAFGYMLVNRPNMAQISETHNSTLNVSQTLFTGKWSFKLDGIISQQCYYHVV